MARSFKQIQVSVVSVRRDIFVALTRRFLFLQLRLTCVPWPNQEDVTGIFENPFRLKGFPEIYLQTMAGLFGHLPGVFIYFDDFLVTGETEEKLHAHLRLLFECCRVHN